MKLDEAYDPNGKVWFSGKAIKTKAFYKPSVSNLMFFTTSPEYAFGYMDTGWRDGDMDKSCCIVATMDKFKLKVFDFTDKEHVMKLKYPKKATEILSNDAFWLSIMTLHEACIDNADADEETITWYKKKFKDLLSKNLSPWNLNKQLYQFQAIILQDIKDLPDKFTAYYCWDYDDEHPGGPTIALFDVDAIKQVSPIVLSYVDVENLIEEVKNHNIDLKNLRLVLDYIRACTGKYA